MASRHDGPPLDEIVEGADLPDRRSGVGSRNGATVTVACKLPNGLVLRTFSEVEKEEEFNGMVRRYRINVPTGETYTLNGAAINIAAAAQGVLPEHPIAGGFALTSDIPKEFWDKWLADNKTTALVRNGLVFSCSDTREAEAEAKQRKGVRSGLEPLDLNNLPPHIRGGRRLQGGGVSGIQRGTMGGNDTDNL